MQRESEGIARDISLYCIFALRVQTCRTCTRDRSSDGKDGHGRVGTHTRELLAANNTSGHAVSLGRQARHHASASIKHASRESI